MSFADVSTKVIIGNNCGIEQTGDEHQKMFPVVMLKMLCRSVPVVRTIPFHDFITVSCTTSCASQWFLGDGFGGFGVLLHRRGDWYRVPASVVPSVGRPNPAGEHRCASSLASR